MRIIMKRLFQIYLIIVLLPVVSCTLFIEEAKIQGTWWLSKNHYLTNIGSTNMYFNNIYTNSDYSPIIFNFNGDGNGSVLTRTNNVFEFYLTGGWQINTTIKTFQLSFTNIEQQIIFITNPVFYYTFINNQKLKLVFSNSVNSNYQIYMKDQ